MLILLVNGWPWITLGLILSLLGFRIIDMPLHQWLQIILRLPFWFFYQPTHTEKKEAKYESNKDEAMENPGCLFLLAGIIMVIYGLSVLAR